MLHKNGSDVSIYPHNSDFIDTLSKTRVHPQLPDTTINSAGGSIVTGNITGTSGQDITITSTGGSTNTALTNGTIGAGGNINTVAITGTSGVVLNGNINTNDAAGNTVAITAPFSEGASNRSGHTRVFRYVAASGKCPT